MVSLLTLWLVASLLAFPLRALPPPSLALPGLAQVAAPLAALTKRDEDPELPDLPPPLTAETFAEAISGDAVFINFFSQESPESRDIEGMWELVYHRFIPNQPHYRLTMHRVDCEVDKELCKKEGVKEYPHLSFYKEGKLLKNLPPDTERRQDDYWQKMFDHAHDRGSIIKKNKAMMLSLSPQGLESVDMRTIPNPLTKLSFQKASQKVPFVFVYFFHPSDKNSATFFPIWISTRHKNRRELERMGIAFHSIDCREQKYLCQGITLFPEIRFYGKGEVAPTLFSAFPRAQEITEDLLLLACKEMIIMRGGDLPCRSKPLLLAELEATTKGTSKKAHVISFWAASEEELTLEFAKEGESLQDRANYFQIHGKDKEITPYQTWKSFSNVEDVFHFSCGTHPDMCERLELKPTDVPEVAVFVPHKQLPIMFRALFELKTLVPFLNKIQNLPIEGKYRQLTEPGLEALKMNYKYPEQPPRFPMDDSNTRVVFVYYGEAEKGELIMDNVVRTIMDLPFAMSMYQSTDGMLPAFAKTRYEATAKHIKYKSALSLEELAFSAPSTPALYCFKEHSVASYALGDAHLFPEDVSKWIRLQGLPAVGPLTTENYDLYFPEESSGKVVVVVVDSLVEKSSGIEDALEVLLSAHHEYTFLKDRYLAKPNSPGDLTQGIDTSFMHFVYLNIADYPDLILQKGWDVGKHVRGQVLIVNSDGSRYSDTGVDGRTLIADAVKLRQVVEVVLQADVAYPTSLVLKQVWKLTHSPYGDKLRFMDKVHDRGSVGYLALLGVVAFGAFVLVLGKRNFANIVRSSRVITMTVSKMWNSGKSLAYARMSPSA